METGNKEEKIPLFKKIRATLCHHCPFCNHARRNPDSAIGKILHHKYHADNCPLWKAEKEVYGEGEEVGSSKVKTLMIWKAF
jgi:hypothetical protein